MLSSAPHCPAFHRDTVPARAVSTLAGPGTEWETARGRGTAEAGELLLFKGEAWPNNEGRSLPHRSPPLGGRPRLVLTLDWVS